MRKLSLVNTLRNVAVMGYFFRNLTVAVLSTVGDGFGKATENYNEKIRHFGEYTL